MMKTVCFVVERLDSGGLENYLLRFLDYKYRGFDRIFVFCRSGMRGLLDEKFEKIPNLSIVRSKIAHANPVDFYRFYLFLKKNRIESICDFSGNMSGPIMLTARLAGTKVRIAQYRGATDHFRSNFFKYIYNRVANAMVKGFATKVLSNSNAALDYFFPNRKPDDPQYEVIYNGLDIGCFVCSEENLREELGIPASAYVIGHTGRYNRAKNHSTILKVAHALCREDENIYFLLCGSGVKDNLENKTAKDVSSRIILLNNRMDIIKVLNSMDCYYFPSLTEGQPNALIEAMAVGLPFVASNIAPIKETVPETEFCRLTNPTDWADAVDKLKMVKNQTAIGKRIDLQDYVATLFDHTILFNKFFDNI